MKARIPVVLIGHDQDIIGFAEVDDDNEIVIRIRPSTAFSEEARTLLQIARNGDLRSFLVSLSYSFVPAKKKGAS